MNFDSMMKRFFYTNLLTVSVFFNENKMVAQFKDTNIAFQMDFPDISPFFELKNDKE